MSHQGLKILYEIVNARPEYLAERVFAPWPDREEQLRREGAPLAALESGRPLAHFDVLGFTLPYELTYTNILTMLDLGGLPLLARDRDERHPLVFGGGPGAFNPEPLADFFDFFLLGDGEEAILEIMDAVARSRAAGEGREAQLARLGRIEGVYVPRWYRAEHDAAGRFAALVPLRDGAPARIRKRILADLDAAPYPVRPPVPFVETTHDRITIEIARGCIQRCRFCQAATTYRPYRERSARAGAGDGRGRPRRDRLRRALAGGALLRRPPAHRDADRRAHGPLRAAPRLDLAALAAPRHDHRPDPARDRQGQAHRLHDRPRGGHPAPARRDQQGRHRGGDPRDLPPALRARLERREALLHGRPADRDRGGPRRHRRARREDPPRRPRGNRPQARGQRRRLELRAQAAHAVPVVGPAAPRRAAPDPRKLREELQKRGATFKWHHPDISALEGLLARGDRRLGRVIHLAWQKGRRFDGWTEQFSLAPWLEACGEAGIDFEDYVCRERGVDEPLPWDHLGHPAQNAFLREERERSLAAAPSPPCPIDACEGCGVCEVLPVHRDAAPEPAGAAPRRAAAGRRRAAAPGVRQGRRPALPLAPRARAGGPAALPPRRGAAGLLPGALAAPEDPVRAAAAARLRGRGGVPRLRDRRAGRPRGAAGAPRRGGAARPRGARARARAPAGPLALRPDRAAGLPRRPPQGAPPRPRPRRAGSSGGSWGPPS